MFFSAEELFKRAGAGGGGGGREVVEEDWVGIGKEYEGGAYKSSFHINRELF